VIRTPFRAAKKAWERGRTGSGFFNFRKSLSNWSKNRRSAALIFSTFSAESSPSSMKWVSILRYWSLSMQ
jgi:hypothetical protein